MAKTAKYTQDAIKRYQNSKDRIVILTEKGTKERLRNVGVDSINSFIVGLIEDALSGGKAFDQSKTLPDSITSSADTTRHRITFEFDSETWDKLQSVSDGNIASWVDDVLTAALTR